MQKPKAILSFCPQEKAFSPRHLIVRRTVDRTDILQNITLIFYVDDVI